MISERIDYQIIEQDGKPTFAVVPYDQFKALLDSVDEADVYIPHDVVRKNAIEGMSMLRAWREHKKLTQAEVAKRMGITQAALAQMEKPDARPRKATLKKFAEALEISIEQLET